MSTSSTETDVLVERTRTAREGEIVVALVEGTDATLKALLPRRQPDPAATLQHRDGPGIYVPAGNVSIQGKVLGVLRKYA